MSTPLKVTALNWANKLTLPRLSFVAWVLDVFSCLYMVRWWQAKQLTSKLLTTALMVNGLSPQDAPPEFESEFHGLTQLLFGGMLLGLIITNAVFYFGFSRKKKWAVPYVTGYLISAGLLGFTFFFEGFPVGGLWELVNIIGTPLYLALGIMAWGVKKELNRLNENPGQ